MSSLETYRQKRNFRITPEPAPKKANKREGFTFCVQKHDATRLHYDFRLELDGVLKSWAVTRGPSLNPADKRLAVRTEDHPLAYGDFEGTIPRGEYGGGTVMLWDEGRWEPIGDPHEGIRKGHMKFRLHGHRMSGGWALVRMYGRDERHENWLLIKEKDAAAKTGRAAEQFLEKTASSVKTHRSMEQIAQGPASWKKGKAQDARAPEKRSKAAARPIKGRIAKTRRGASLDSLVKKYPDVQLATLVDDIPAGDGWIHEVKFDGYRLLCFVSGGKARLISRNGKDWTDKFPRIAAGLQDLDISDGVFDGEAVVMDEKGRSSFQKLQTALGDLGDTRQVEIYLFDLLYLNGEDVTGRPLIERKELLRKTIGGLGAGAPIHYSEHLDKGGAALSRACRLGLEGLVSKDRTAPYMKGRSRQWLKSKCIKRQEFVIIGITITHPDREVFEDVHVTKRDLADYYAAVAPAMLQQMGRHPISLLRCPGGVGKQCFFQRNPDEHMKKYIKPFPLMHGGKLHEYLYVEDAKGVVFLSQMGVIEFHPWSAAADNIDNPLCMIFDLDPAEDVAFDAVKRAAQDVRQRLKKMQLESFVKCTGGKGLHVTVPLSGKNSWEEVYAFSRRFARRMADDVPEAYVATMSKQKRRGRIFIDYFRNNYASSAIADYSVRARPGAPVAVPLEWRELKNLAAGNRFTMAEAAARAKKRALRDPRYRLKQRLPKI